ncbi:MAG: hypothetical protein V4556_08755 [Bacteroidota bacterium]
MIYLRKFYISSPGGENGSSNTSGNSNANDQTDKDSNDKKKEDKPFLQKVKEALQDWSNKDEMDTEFDDTRV